jgi:hypothetical protein
MDALFVIVAVISIMALLGAAAAAYGVDSRPGLIDDRIRHTYS